MADFTPDELFNLLNLVRRQADTARIRLRESQARRDRRGPRAAADWATRLARWEAIERKLQHLAPDQLPGLRSRS
jgi:hypothetical protein